MALDSVTPLTALQALLVGLVGDDAEPIFGVSAVSVGVPTVIGNAIGAYVALAGQHVVIKAQGVIQRTADYYIGFCYQVNGAPAGAELALAEALDVFLRKIYLDLSLGGLTTRVDVNLAVAAAPLYQNIGAQEYRVFPAVLTLTQQDTYKVNP